MQGFMYFLCISVLKLTFAVPIAVSIGVLALFNLPPYTQGENFTAIGLLFTCFG